MTGVERDKTSVLKIQKKIGELLAFAIHHKMLGSMDELPARNALYDLLGIIPVPEDSCPGESPPEPDELKSETASEIVGAILDYAAGEGLLPENTTTYRDLMDARIMGLLMPRQSEIISGFYKSHERSPKEATAEFYALCRFSNYIQVDRISKNLYWQTPTEFGDLEITVNLSKPEKDPKEIAAARSVPQTGYPKCLLCVENVGFAGNLVHPARQNLRVIPMELCGEEWYFQYSPYVYYNEHCIVLSRHHVPMRITEATFKRLFDFVKMLPHYFIGSNADLPIVGGSILTHDHFQGGRHVFPMEKAPCYRTFEGRDAEISLVKWPLSVIRIAGSDTDYLTGLSMDIVNAWREYSDCDAEIHAYTGETPHNTVTPIVRINSRGLYECDLVLRNNRTSAEHPLGIFHPHAELHHIKKENIGLIEVMGLAVLPGRLEKELDEIAGYLTGEKIDYELVKNPDHPLYQHEHWIEEMIGEFGRKNTARDAESILKDQVGRIFKEVLCDAGVFKTDEKGRGEFVRFMKACGLK